MVYAPHFLSSLTISEAACTCWFARAIAAAGSLDKSEPFECGKRPYTGSIIGEPFWPRSVLASLLL